MTSTTDPASGQPLTVTDANGLVTSTVYDAFGRPEQVTPPLGTGQPAYTRFAWCNAGCGEVNAPNSQFITYKVTTYQAGVPETTVYKDMFNRVLVTRVAGFDGSYIYTRTEYDNLGRERLKTVPSYDASLNTGEHYNAYDALGRPTEKVIDQAQGQAMTVRYNYNGFITNITANGLSMSRVYSGDGKLMQTTDAQLGVTAYAYDAMGNPIVMQDANGNRITAEYNALGQKKWVNDPNMGRKDFTYTGFGEVESETDANGDAYFYHYDAIGRLDYRTLNGIPEARYSFDTAAKGTTGGVCKGMLTKEESLDSNAFSRSIGYDDYCRPVTTTTTIDGESFTMSNQYDGNYGRIKAVTYPNSLTVATEYNSLGYMTKSVNAKSGYVYREVTEMDERLNWTRALAANGILEESRYYDFASGQMLSVDAVAVAGLEQRHSISYQYDSFGNLLQQQTQVTENGQPVTATESFTYDTLHRLTHSNVAVSNGYSKSDDFTYDSVGNFTYKSDYASSYSYGNAAKTLGGNAGPNAVRSINKVGGGTASYSYDNNGNMLSGDGRTISYNAFNKPTVISKGGITSQFFYGSDQMRYKQVKTGLPNGTETTLYVGKAYEEIRYNGSVQKKLYLGDVIITEQSGGSNAGNRIAFVHRDRLGSVVTLTDQGGNVIENRSYDPFGKPRLGTFANASQPKLFMVAYEGGYLSTPSQELLSTSRGFTDHEHLDDAELIHMNGRAYDYRLGRFLSVDPVIQSPGNSQSMNPYSYIMNNPLAGTDPSGYQTVWDRKECESRGGNCNEELGKVFKQLGFEVSNGKVNLNKTKGVTGQKIEDLMSDRVEDAFNISVFYEGKRDRLAAKSITGATERVLVALALAGAGPKLACSSCGPSQRSEAQPSRSSTEKSSTSDPLAEDRAAGRVITITPDYTDSIPDYSKARNLDELLAMVMRKEYHLPTKPRFIGWKQESGGHWWWIPWRRTFAECACNGKVIRKLALVQQWGVMRVNVPPMPHSYSEIASSDPGLTTAINNSFDLVEAVKVAHEQGSRDKAEILMSTKGAGQKQCNTLERYQCY